MYLSYISHNAWHGAAGYAQKNGQLTSLAKRLLSLEGKDIPIIDDLEELDRLCYGNIVYKKLWDKYQFTPLFSRIAESRKIVYELWETVYLLVIDRLLNPRSKLALFQRQGKYLNIRDVSLQHIYRCLDILADAKAQIESHIFSRQRNLFNLRIDVVFYDVTTYHFGSVRTDKLKDFGFCKAGKLNEVQVVMGLLPDRDQAEDERQIAKAQKMIASHKKPSNKKGYRRYIATRGDQEVVGLDEGRISEDIQWDGYAGIQSSETGLDAKSVIDACHQL